MEKTLPIGNDQFRLVRENGSYYVDKTLMIEDFIKYNDTAALITRPRRFGKTINMTMLREFFDITKDSRQIFANLAIMDTDYGKFINSRPVIYFSFKDCTANNQESLRKRLAKEMLNEYTRYAKIFDKDIDKTDIYVKIFYRNMEGMADGTISFDDMSSAIEDIIRVIHDYYNASPVLLIDEYDQPILSSYENGFKQELGEFFAAFYGSALKSNQYLGQALLTGIQRVAKESIFSKLNNIKVYTVVDTKYAPYFGLTGEETRKLLEYYNLTLNDEVKRQYDGYKFGNIEIYNPWSVLNYADSKKLMNFWINTSTNYLIRQALSVADDYFNDKFNDLIENGSVEVGINLETSFIELQNNYSLWGLLVNSGYLTVVEYNTGRGRTNLMTVKIPNDEVKSEFQMLIAEKAKIQNDDLDMMFQYLFHKDIENFIKIYSQIVLSCTSYYDAKENAYHMLFLGMCITLRGLYKVSSNLEAGYGRSDIMLESISKRRSHIIIEFKQGKDIEKLKEDAVNQILKQNYFKGLTGDIICIGLAHNKKECKAALREIHVE